MSETWILRKDGHEIACHSTRRACVVEAYERGLALHIADNRDTLVNGVTIRREGQRHAD